MPSQSNASRNAVYVIQYIQYTVFKVQRSCTGLVMLAYSSDKQLGQTIYYMKLRLLEYVCMICGVQCRTNKAFCFEQYVHWLNCYVSTTSKYYFLSIYRCAKDISFKGNNMM